MGIQKSIIKKVIYRYEEKEKLTYTIWEKKLWHNVQHVAVWKDNYIDSMTSSPTFKSIGWSLSFCMSWTIYKYWFSKPSLESSWHTLCYSSSLWTFLKSLCFLYSIFLLLISCSEIVVTQVSKAWEKSEKSCEVHKCFRHHWERFLSWWKKSSSRLSESVIELGEACCNKEYL